MSPGSPSFLIVEARFYEDIADLLVDGAAAALEEAGATHDLIAVPGALEIPGAIAAASRDSRYAGYVALGCVIRGETYHYEVVCNESARGLMDLSLGRGLAIGNGILTVENRGQAEERAGHSGGDKGGAAARAAIAMAGINQRYPALPDG